MSTKKVKTDDAKDENSEGEHKIDLSGFEKPIYSPEEMEEDGQPKGWMRAVICNDGAKLEIRMKAEDLVKLFEAWMRDTPEVEDIMLEALKRHNVRNLMEHILSNEDDEN